MPISFYLAEGDSSNHTLSPETHSFAIDLTRLALGGAALQELLESVCSTLQAPVSLEDREFNLLAHASPSGKSARSLEAMIRAEGTPPARLRELEDSGVLRQLRHQEQGLTTLGAGCEQPEPRHVLPVLVGGQLHGFLSCFDVDGQAGQDAPKVLQAAQAGIAVGLLRDSGLSDGEHRMRQQFQQELLGEQGPVQLERLQRKASYLGIQLAPTYWPVMLEFDVAPPEDQLADEVRKLCNTLNGLLSFRQAVITSRPRGATVLYPVKDGHPGIDKIKEMAESLRQKAVQSLPAWGASVGVGELPQDCTGIHRGLLEARHALRIGRTTHGNGRVTSFNELGIFRMLLQFAHSQDPGEFACDALQRLLDYDQQADKELVKTLHAFLSCNGNLTETSDRLYIHRNTLKYRLERIRDITQVDLDESEQRLMLHLGLKMHQISQTLRERG